MEKLLLHILRLMKPLLGIGGSDFDQMMVIVETKLLMDKRRVYMNWRNSQQKEGRNQMSRVLLFYFVIGILMGSLVYVLDNFLTVMVFMHAYFLFMMAMTLITDFSSVLLDTTDNLIIFSRPVSSKAVFMARMVHILIYLLQFTIAIGAGGWIFAFLKYGMVSGFVFLSTSILTVLLAVFLTYFLYLGIFRFSNEQRVKDIVTYFQIGMTIFFTLGFQLFPRMINMVDIRHAVEFRGWAFVLPPVWMSLTNEAFLNRNFDSLHVWMICISVIVPLLSFRILNRFLAPLFVRKLSILQNDRSSLIGRTDKGLGEELSHGSISTGSRSTISSLFSSLVCKGFVEGASFETTWMMTSRDKGFRMQFYPGLAYILMFFLVFVLKGKGDIMANWHDLPGTQNFLWLIYLPMMTISSGITLISFNEHFNASWIFHSSPLSSPGSIIAGAAKSIFFKYFIPVYMIMCALCLFIWGTEVVDDLVFGFFCNGLCYTFFVNVSDHYLPFSRQPNVRQQSGRFAKAMIQLMVVSLLVGVHYLLIGRSILLLALAPVMAIIMLYFIHRIQTLPWSAIKI